MSGTRFTPHWKQKRFIRSQLSNFTKEKKKERTEEMKPTFTALIERKLGADFTLHNKEGVELDPHQTYDQYNGIIKWKGTEIIQGNWTEMDTTTLNEVILSLPPSIRVTDLLDFLCSVDVQHTLFLDTGLPRKRWFNNLIKRVIWSPSAAETSKRMQIFIDNLPAIEAVKQFVPHYNDIMGGVIPDVISGKLIYRNSTYPTRTSVFSGYFLKDGVVSYQTYAKSQEAFDTYTIGNDTIILIFNREEVTDWVDINGAVFPKAFEPTLLENGNISYCPTCGVLMEGHERECRDCCPYDETELVLKSYGAKATDFYSFKIHAKNKNKTKTPKFFGVELEYEVNGTVATACAYTLKRVPKHVILKRDGSLSNGLEIVSAPADMETHKELYKQFFEEFSSSEMKAMPNTGMHIHVDKGDKLTNVLGETTSYTKMSYLTLGKIANFMQNEDNKNFIKFIGERESTYATLGGGEQLTNQWKGNTGRRHRGINMTNEQTIEFRIFATPTNYTNFCKNLEFADAVTDFCGNGTASIKQMTVPDFLTYVNSNRGMYPNLTKFVSTYDTTIITEAGA
jgi:hypothetical protein